MDKSIWIFLDQINSNLLSFLYETFYFLEDISCSMLLLRGWMRKKKSSLICYKEENDQENKTKIIKVQCERVWGMKKEGESKRRQNSSENKAFRKGWKGLDVDAYLRKWSLEASSQPQMPSFSSISLSLSHFTAGSRARNLVEISLSKFICSLPDNP